MSSRRPLEFSLLNVLDVLRTARFSSARWRPLGLRLIPDHDLNAIQADNATVEERLEKVIDMWQRDGDKPSWETLAEAVSRCDGGGKNVGRRIQQQVGLLEPQVEETDSGLLERPTLPELVQLKVHQQVGANYNTFGILLLNDVTGIRVRNFHQACLGNPEDVVLRILQEWLEGKGLPVTWETLLQTLRNAGLHALADQIGNTKFLSHGNFRV